MNSKERVKAAIAREPVDRVPIGLYAVDHDTIAAVIGRPTVVRNQLAMQLALWEGRRADMVQQWKADLTDFYRKIDCVDIITWGGVPLEILIDGTVAETRQAVRRTLALAGRGGGIILGPSQSIAQGTKYDNFMAMLEDATR